jgi:hypothetical protein
LFSIFKRKKEKQKNPRKTDKKIKKPKNLRKPEAETRKLEKRKNNKMSNGPARVGE